MALYEKRIENDSVGFSVKVKQRMDNIPDKDTLKILDAFAGEGLIWNEIKKTRHCEVTTLEKRKDINPNNIICNNMYWMLRNDLSKFDVIDLDAYSCPYEQLKIVFNQKFKGVVFFTFIQTGLGTLKRDLLLDLYGSTDMVNKMRTMFIKNGFDIFCKWLYKKGVDKINYQHIKAVGGNKYYGYFNLF